MSNLKIFLTLELCSMCSRCRSMIRLMQAWQLFIWIYVANNDNDKWNEISSQQQQQKIVRKTEKHKIDGCLPFFSPLFIAKKVQYMQNLQFLHCARTHTLVKLHPLTSHVSSNFGYYFNVYVHRNGNIWIFSMCVHMIFSYLPCMAVDGVYCWRWIGILGGVFCCIQ